LSIFRERLGVISLAQLLVIVAKEAGAGEEKKDWANIYGKETTRAHI